MKRARTFLLALIFATSVFISCAQTLQTIYSFANTNGAIPDAALTLGNDGNYYGTTMNGGSSYYGTIFKVTPDGTLTTLVSFNNTNGANPYAALTLGDDGNFYGTTMNGGIANSQNTVGMGTVFKMTTNGTLITLVSFNYTNGAHPWAALTLGNNGNFYGTTANGGTIANASTPNGAGTVFQMTPNAVCKSTIHVCRSTFAVCKSTFGVRQQTNGLCRSTFGVCRLTFGVC